jgi:hypothetical protein
MRTVTAAFAARTIRVVVLPTLGALALACDDAPSFHEPHVSANVAGALARDGSPDAGRLGPGPSRQALAALIGGPRYWADGYAAVANPVAPGPYPSHVQFSYNRSGRPVTITKPAGTTGRYVVTFAGLSAGLGSKSTVHVTSDVTGSNYAIPDDVHCKPMTAFLVSDRIEVRCFRTSTGAAANGVFRVMVTRNFFDLAFAYAHLPTSTGYAPAAQGSWNPAGTSSVVRQGVGRYDVVFDSLGSQLPDGVGGHVQVNAVGPDNAHCKLENWAGTTDRTVSVRCFTSAGQPVDSRFTVLVLTPTDHLAYAIGHQPSAQSYSPLTAFSSNPAASSIIITRSGAGRYRIRWVFTDPLIFGLGTIQVTAWGSDNTQCKTNTYFGFTVEHADVLCFGPNGVPTDARYAVLLAS